MRGGVYAHARLALTNIIQSSAGGKMQSSRDIGGIEGLAQGMLAKADADRRKIFQNNCCKRRKA